MESLLQDWADTESLLRKSIVLMDNGVYPEIQVSEGSGVAATSIFVR